MSDHFLKTIDVLETKLRDQLSEVGRLKRMINDLCSLAGMPPRYSDALVESAPTVGAMRSDQFYGRPLATVVREYLEMRKGSNLGPASVGEIHTALIEGGFKFETSNEENAKRGLRVSLSKNSTTFHKLPNGDWGLLDWYPAAKNRVARETKNGDEESVDEAPSLDEPTPTTGQANSGA